MCIRDSPSSRIQHTLYTPNVRYARHSRHFTRPRTSLASILYTTCTLYSYDSVSPNIIKNQSDSNYIVHISSHRSPSTHTVHTKHTHTRARPRPRPHNDDDDDDDADARDDDESLDAIARGDPRARTRGRAIDRTVRRRTNERTNERTNATATGSDVIHSCLLYTSPSPRDS